MTTTLPRQLPITIPPAHHEILASYLARLARLNSIDGDELWKRVSIPAPTPTRRIVTAERMAALTGRRGENLAGALPELRDPKPHWTMFRHAPQPGCKRCDARHRGGAVLRVLPHHRYVCTRHGYWVGPPDITATGPSLTHCPQIVAAQRQHLRLVQRYGWAAAYDAVLTAFMICAHRWNEPRPTTGLRLQQDLWTKRSLMLIPEGTEPSTFTASKLFACLYPEAIALSPVIAAPRWRQHAAGDAHQLALFVAELRRRLRDNDYQPRGERDAIAHWIEADCWRQPATPPTTFDKAPGHRKPSQLRHRNPFSDERTWRSATWFGLKNRRGAGDVVLHHRTLRPVIVRKWSPDMQEYRGAIWNSQRTEKRFKQP
ncbi:hypothetical protein ACIHAX_32200 [Nocardia sp. NPDC051929]|uniref:hypothetical protein n=1 Tax=unclassified Nocardia TaxID=2637762 RepID=UPI003440BCE3